MDVILTPELEQMVRQKVKSGDFSSPSEVVREALRLMGERERLETWRKEEIRAQIATGLDSLRAGRGEDGETVFDRLEAEIAADERRARE